MQNGINQFGYIFGNPVVFLYKGGASGFRCAPRVAIIAGAGVNTMPPEIGLTGDMSGRAEPDVELLLCIAFIYEAYSERVE